MNLHPQIHSELARQRSLELRRSPAPSRRGSRPEASDDLEILVRAAQSGGGDAWQNLVERFTPMMRGVVRGYRLSPADVDDVVQTAWASAFTHLGRLREPLAFGGWLLVTARREALRTLERRAREVLVDEPTYVDENDNSAPDRALLEAERRKAVHAAIKRLPERQRKLVGKLLGDSVSYEDVSRDCGMPIGSIGPTRDRAIARLRRDPQLVALHRAAD
jgi:RNA polymerase sigma factor (sigma-70 family)